MKKTILLSLFAIMLCASFAPEKSNSQPSVRKSVVLRPGENQVLENAGYTSICFTGAVHPLHRVYWWEIAYEFTAIAPDGRPTMGCVCSNRINIHLHE